MTPSDDALKQQAAAIVSHATGLALQGDAAAAVAELAHMPKPIPDGEEATFRDEMIKRFGADSVPARNLGVDDPWVADLAALYVAYWHQVLTKRQSLEDAELALQQAVGALLGHAVVGNDQLEALEAEIEAEVAKRGFHILLGRTLPLLEFMLWKKQTTAEVEVQLPEESQPMTVTYMDDFVLRGWGYYATCGRRSAGGWATEKGLFAVVPAYKRLDDETFTVRFLGHEAQHNLDFKIYGADTLESWELEYRAKLTELALGHTTQSDTLKIMCENRSDSSKQTPHSYANFLVMQNLEQYLNQADLCEGVVSDAQAIRDAAKALLIQDSLARGVTQ